MSNEIVSRFTVTITLALLALAILGAVTFLAYTDRWAQLGEAAGGALIATLGVAIGALANRLGQNTQPEK